MTVHVVCWGEVLQSGGRGLEELTWLHNWHRLHHLPQVVIARVPEETTIQSHTPEIDPVISIDSLVDLVNANNWEAKGEGVHELYITHNIIFLLCNWNHSCGDSTMLHCQQLVGG